MAKYIDIESLVVVYSGHTPDDDFSKGVDFVLDFLDSKPPADVKPVLHGHWERLEGDSRFMCSVCKWKENVPTIMGKPTVWDYCPSCGALIRERNEH